MSDSDDILNTGTATQTQLAKLFHRNKSDMPRLLHGIAPVGKRRNYDVYSIAEAAPALVKPTDAAALEAAIRRMNKTDLPPELNSAFWTAMRTRDAYEIAHGNLWQTSDVEAMVTAILHEVSIQAKLMRDNVERQVGLTPAQGQVIDRIAEAMVNGCREAVEERFDGWAAPQDNVGAEEVL